MNHLGRPASRRVVVLGTLAGVSAALAGCGVRLEDGAPNIPFVPTREPIPGESALIALLRDCASLRDLAAGTPGPVASGLVTLHDRQHEVLRDALRARGVPDRLIDGDSSPETSSSAPSPTIPSSAPAPTPADLAAAELTTVTDGAPLRGIARDLVPTVSSLLAQRISAATLLTGAPPTRPVDPAAQSPTGSPTSASPPPAPPPWPRCSPQRAPRHTGWRSPPPSRRGRRDEDCSLRSRASTRSRARSSPSSPSRRPPHAWASRSPTP